MNTNKVKSALLGIAAATSAALPLAANADPSVTIDSVVQRWPWNNKVDITYTVTGGQTRSAGVYCGLRFAVSVNGVSHNFEGYTLGASAENGTHTITWTAPSGIVSDACSMTATLFSTNVPSGNDYMIVDLNTGAVWYEGLASSQAESNARYNTDLYKGTNTAGECFMVLRKVPRTADSGDLPNGPFASGYPTGDSAHYSSSNASKTWTTDRDYYIGIFPVTQQQYQNVCGSNPSGKKSSIAGNKVTHRPVENVTWNDLRLSTTASTSSIPAVVSNSGTFFQRLNYKSELYFDLPTEVMFEIAERSGTTTYYYWGDTMVTNYVVCKENSGSSTVAVGSRLPNNWGLYDMAGNVWEWCLDDTSSGNLTSRSNAFIPACTGGTRRRYRGGQSWNDSSSNDQFRASYRDGAEPTTKWNYTGFRVSMIVND